jgi:hypothetical protein
MEEPGPIILVEDPFIRNYLRFLLIRHGYSVVESEPSRACELVDSTRTSVVITNKPESFVGCAPNLALIYLATAPDLDVAAKFPSCRVVRKPFQPGELLSAIEQLLSPA